MQRRANLSKASVVRNICTEGVLYCEVVEPKVFVRKLAKEIRMKIALSLGQAMSLGYVNVKT